MGAAALFGCGDVYDAQSPVDSDLESGEASLCGVADPEHMHPEGYDAKAFKKSFNTGFKVNNSTSFANYDKMLGPCDNPDKKCIWPNTSQTGIGKSWNWRFDRSNCHGWYGEDLLYVGMKQAFARAASGTGWSFPELTSGSGERITVYCMYPAERAAISSAAVAMGYPYGNLSTISTPTPTANTFDKCNGSGPEFDFAFNDVSKYSSGGITIDTDRFLSFYDGPGVGGSVGCGQTGSEDFIIAAGYNLILHELGHVLGFVHNLGFPMIPNLGCGAVYTTLASSAFPNGWRAYSSYMKDALLNLDTSGGTSTSRDSDVACLGPFSNIGAFLP